MLSHDVRIWLCAGYTDMRKGFDGLGCHGTTCVAKRPIQWPCVCVSWQRQRPGQITLVGWPGIMFVLQAFRARPVRSAPCKSGAVHLTQAELALLLEGLDWRPPARKSAPKNAA